MKVIISGGGTGGHVFPAISIAQALKNLEPNTKILFVGAEGKLEMKKVPEAGFEIKGLTIAGFHRKSFLRNLTFPFKLIAGMRQAYRIIKAFKPNAVVGVGGYASGPILYIAGLLKIPTLIQEQNSFAGMTNKILSKKAAKICVAYDGMDRFFDKHKIVYTGNPVRQDLLNIEIKKAEAMAFFHLDLTKKTVLVMGGSLGARTLNETMTSNIDLIRSNEDIQWIWQYGNSAAAEFGSCELATLPNIRAMAFIDRSDLAYAAADLILCRAGALTVSELAITGKAAILVPSPTVAENHQTHNAQALVSKRAAIMIEDKDARALAIHRIIELLKDSTEINVLKTELIKLAKPDAALTIAKCIFSLNNSES